MLQRPPFDVGALVGATGILVSFLGGPHGLRRRALERAAKQCEQVAPLGCGESCKKFVFRVRDDPSSPLKEPAAVRGDRDFAGSAVVRCRSALGQPGTLELIDQRDHRRAVDAHRCSELLLDSSFACSDDVEQGEQGGRKSNRRKRIGDPRVRSAPQPEEELPGELGDRRIGRRTWTR